MSTPSDSASERPLSYLVSGPEDVDGSDDELAADGTLAHPFAALGAGDHVTALQQHAVYGGVHADPAQPVLQSGDGVCEGEPHRHHPIIITCTHNARRNSPAVPTEVASETQTEVSQNQNQNSSQTSAKPPEGLTWLRPHAIFIINALPTALKLRVETKAEEHQRRPGSVQPSREQQPEPAALDGGFWWTGT